MSKATDAERIIRIQTVREMIIKGCDRAFIIRYAADTWKIGDRAVDYYLKEAKQIIKNDFESNFDKKLFKADIYHRLQDLYQKNYTIQDFRECRNIVADFCKMFGLAEPQEIVNTNININSEPLSKEELKKAADELEGEL